MNNANNQSDKKVIVLSFAFFFLITSIFTLIFFGIKIFLGPGLKQSADYAGLLLTILILLASIMLIIKNRKYTWYASSKKLNKTIGLLTIAFGIILLMNNLIYHKSSIFSSILFILLGALSLRQSKPDWKPASVSNVKARSKYPIIIGLILIILGILCWNLPYQMTGYRWVFLSGGIGALLGGLMAPYIHKKTIR